jgi:transposase-like protein
MDLIKLMEAFPDQEACISYLERLRWDGEPECPHCGSGRVRRRFEYEDGRIGLWNCHECRSTFKVTHGTVFHKTKTPLQKWFVAIALMANAKKSLSSHQLARDLGLKQKTAWRIMMAVRAEMGKDNVLLQGIVEADETYIGGKKCKDYSRDDGQPRKRGRGTAKDAVLGAIQRGGKVIAQLVPNTTGQTIRNFIQKFVKTDDSELYTDQYRAYNKIGKEMKHETMNRSEKWKEGAVHTNTMEGFWSFVKRAWYGQHHHYSTGYTPLYLVEACYKYNYRETNMFWKFLKESVR